jgi:hypothetical protein
VAAPARGCTSMEVMWWLDGARGGWTMHGLCSDAMAYTVGTERQLVLCHVVGRYLCQLGGRSEVT